MNGSGSSGHRRRRSHRRRHLRRIRITAAASVLLGMLLVGWLVFPRSRSYPSPVVLDNDSAASPAPDYAALAARIPVRHSAKIHHYPIFNYSVVRGGVHSVEELRQAIAHDRAVAQHYAKFQYDHARLVRLQKPALVYLSYRMNGKIYWTRTRHRLNEGEELITDGTIAARTKCANQISSRKQLAVSPEEPPAAALEQVEPPPLLPPAESKYPVLYKEALLTPGPAAPWVGPSLGPVFPLAVAPLPSGIRGLKPVCETEWQEKHEAKLGIDDDESKEVHCPPHHRKPPAAVPEPGTWLLMGSGVVGIYVALRRRQACRT